jgi:hypothetical protein
MGRYPTTSRRVRSLLKKSPSIRRAHTAVKQAKERLRYSGPVVGLFRELDKHDRLRALEGEFALRRSYRRFHGARLPESSPREFADFLYCRMLEVVREGNPEYTLLADKFRARKFAADRIGEQALIPVLWHGTDADSIPFDALPEKYIVKVNHGSGGHLVVEGRPDKAEIARRMKTLLSKDFSRGPGAREYHYKAIPPQIVIEELLDDGNTLGPLDYRFWCFAGQPRLVQVDDRVHGINPFYDPEWRKVDLSYREEFRDVDIPRPRELEEMLEIASKLSAGFDFVRVDLYDVHGHIYFGEMTFTPFGGRLRFRPEEWNRKLGDWWRDAKARTEEKPANIPPTDDTSQTQDNETPGQGATPPQPGGAATQNTLPSGSANTTQR